MAQQGNKMVMMSGTRVGNWGSGGSRGTSRRPHRSVFSGGEMQLSKRTIDGLAWADRSSDGNFLIVADGGEGVKVQCSVERDSTRSLLSEYSTFGCCLS